MIHKNDATPEQAAKCEIARLAASTFWVANGDNGMKVFTNYQDMLRYYVYEGQYGWTFSYPDVIEVVDMQEREIEIRNDLITMCQEQNEV